MKKPNIAVSFVKYHDPNVYLRDKMNELMKQAGGEEVQTDCEKIKEGVYTGTIAIVEEGENIVGMGWLWPLQRPGHQEAEIHTLIVDKKYRRKGIGTAIVQKLIEEAKNIEATKIRFETSIDNEPEAKFCQKLGFKLVNNSYHLPL